jgi:hypothetical protein
MKSKTLQLIEKYVRLLEQDEQDPNAGMEQAPPQEGQPAPEAPAEEANPVPLTSIAEINYIKHVVMALLYATTTNVSEADKSNLKELEVALQDDDEAQELLQQSGKTGKEFYEEEILPIIMGIQNEKEEAQNLNSIS